MLIEDMRKQDTQQFHQIGKGEVFEYNDKICMRLDQGDQCVNLANGSTLNVIPYDEVTVLDARLIVNEIIRPF